MIFFKTLNKKALLLLFVSGLAAYKGHTQKSTKNSVSQQPVKVTSVEGITEYKLSNGLHVLLFPDPSKPTITVNATYLVGSRHEGYGETGMAHLLEHMVFKGSTKHPNIPKELTDHGASPNGSTWYDRTNYFETFAATDENLNWALDLESDRMVNSFIAKKDLQSEFSVVRNEFEAGENYPSSILMERIISTAYVWHNYGKSTIGSKEDIERVPIENLQAFYKKYYQPDNAVLMVTGKIEEAKTLQLVNQYFGAIARPLRKLQEAYTMEPVQDGERFVSLRRVGDVQVVGCAYHIPSGTHPDYAPLDILNEVLTNQPAGRLYKALVETQKASSEYGFSFALKDPGINYFSADVLKEKSVDDAKNTMISVLDSISIKPTTAEEVERARAKLLRNFEEFYRNSERIGLQMSEFMAQGDWRTAFIYRDNVKKASVDDVNRVAKLYFKNSNRTVGVFIPDKTPNRAAIPPPPDVAAMVKDYKGQKVLTTAEAFDASPANIDKRTKTGTIPGGAKYAVLAKTTRGGTVHLQITLRVGNENSLQNKKTIVQLTAQMMRRGTQNKTFQQLNDTLDKLQSHVLFTSYRQTISVDIESIKDNLSKVLQLTNEMLRLPSFPENEFNTLKQEQLANIDQQKSDPQAIAFNVRNRLEEPYPTGHIYSTPTFDEQTKILTSTRLDDIKSFYRDFLGDSGATISIVGDCNEGAIVQQVNDMMRNWSSRQLFVRVPRKYFNVAGTEQKMNTPDKKNAVFLADLVLQINDENKDYAALIMGDYIFGGGFLNSRLASRLRQKEGLSYGAGSNLFTNELDTISYFGSYAIYNPENLKKLDKAYKEEVDKLLKEGITADELKAAKIGYLQSQQVQRSDDSYLTRQLNSNLYLKRNLDWYANQEKQISNLTVDQVNAALRKYFRPDKIIYVKAGDFSKAK